MTPLDQTVSLDQRIASRPLIGVSLAYFMVLLDVTILAVAEPDLIATLHTTVLGVGWATTSYTITFAALLVLSGAVADRAGAHRVFRLGVVGFGALSLLCAAAPTIGALVAVRALLGVCAAAIVPSSMAIIAHLFPQPDRRSAAIGVWAAVSGLALSCGPILGGVLVDAFDWRAVFVLNLPIAVLALGLTAGGDITCSRRARRLDPWPHLAAAGFLAALTVAITEAGRVDVIAAVAAAACLALLALTRAADRRAATPLVPPAIRASRPVLAAFTLGAAVNYGLTTILFVLPLQDASQRAFTIGAMLLPMTVPIAVNPLLTVKLVRRFGPVPVITSGLSALLLGVAGVIAASELDAPYPARAAALIVCGLGISWALPSLVAYTVNAAPVGAVGAVGGLLNASRQIGATAAAATAAGLVVRDDVHTGGVALGIAAAVVAAAVAIALTQLRGPAPTNATVPHDP